MIVATPTVVWVLSDAVDLVRGVQQVLHSHRWHCALGGGVLNRGESTKDADLYILPFDDGHDVPEIMPILAGLWGPSEPIFYGSQSIWEHKVKFSVHSGKRIDVFIGRRGKVSGL